MPLTSELKRHSNLKSQADAQCFSSIVKKMALTKNNKYIPVILSYLNDDSEHIDLMKELIGMAESFNSTDYVQSVLDLTESLSKIAPEWLEYITYRITNSETYSNIYKTLLSSHANNHAIKSYLLHFSKKNPEKKPIVKSILETDG